MKEEDLMNRLRSLKHYFFLDTGDFFIHFLDAADDELSKPVSAISPEKLDSLLDLSLRMSSAANDPYKEDLSCDLSRFNIIEVLLAKNFFDIPSASANYSGQGPHAFTNSSKMKGYECFQLKYAAKWPLNLIFSQTAMVSYQCLFRHLFFCKYIERQLNNIWLINQSKKELFLPKAFSSSFILIQRMLHYIKNLVYNLSYEVFEPKWLRLEQDLLTVRNFDEIIKLHSNYLEGCLHESLLRHESIFQKMTLLNVSIINFTATMQQFNTNMSVGDHRLQVHLQGTLDKEMIEETKHDAGSSLKNRKKRIEVNLLKRKRHQAKFLQCLLMSLLCLLPFLHSL